MKNPNAPGSNRYIGGVYVLDPVTKKPVSPGVTIQQVDGGFDPTGLSTEEKQDAILAALDTLTAAIQAGDLTEVTVTDDALPPVEGQATATKQDQILSALNTLASLATEAATFRENGTQAVSLESTPLPVGAATAAKQDAITAALGTLAEALSQTLNVAGTVSLSDEPIDVTGSVAITNSDIAVKPAPGTTYPVTVEGASTAAKQDSILTALGNLLTALQAPQPITDNGGSLTVDGSVGISGAVQVEDNGKSLTVDGTVAATQSGTWSVGITGTPTVAVQGPVVVQDADGGPMAVNGTVTVGNASIPVTQQGTWTMQTTPGASATSAALTSFRNGSITATPTAIKTSSGRVYQYTFFNMNNAPVFVHLYDALVANVTPGTTMPKMTFALPAGSTLDGYWSISHGFSTAISIAASTAWAGSGVPTTPVMVTVGYA